MKKILIINNDPDTMQLLQDLLQIKGFNIKYTVSKDEVPGLLKSFDPDLVLLDITQTSAMEHFQDEAEARGLPILLMTGHNSYPSTKESNFKHFIRKPFRLEELLKRIEGVLPAA